MCIRSGKIKWYVLGPCCCPASKHKHVCKQWIGIFLVDSRIIKWSRFIVQRETHKWHVACRPGNIWDPAIILLMEILISRTRQVCVSTIKSQLCKMLTCFINNIQHFDKYYSTKMIPIFSAFNNRQYRHDKPKVRGVCFEVKHQSKFKLGTW